MNHLLTLVFLACAANQVYFIYDIWGALGAWTRGGAPLPCTRDSTHAACVWVSTLADTLRFTRYATLCAVLTYAALSASVSLRRVAAWMVVVSFAAGLFVFAPPSCVHGGDEVCAALERVPFFRFAARHNVALPFEALVGSAAIVGFVLLSLVVGERNNNARVAVWRVQPSLPLTVLLATQAALLGVYVYRLAPSLNGGSLDALTRIAPTLRAALADANAAETHFVHVFVESVFSMATVPLALLFAKAAASGDYALRRVATFALVAQAASLIVHSALQLPQLAVPQLDAALEPLRAQLTRVPRWGAGARTYGALPAADAKILAPLQWTVLVVALLYVLVGERVVDASKRTAAAAAAAAAAATGKQKTK